MKKIQFNKKYTLLSFLSLMLFSYVSFDIYYNLHNHPNQSGIHNASESEQIQEDSNKSPGVLGDATTNPSNSGSSSTQKTSTNAPTGQTNTPYVASVCSKKYIHYKTIYKNVDYLDQGETKTYGGSDGWVQSCTRDSNGYKPSDVKLDPYDKTVYVGTNPPPPAPPPPPTPADLSALRSQLASQAAEYARAKCAPVPSNSSSYGYCLQQVQASRYRELLNQYGL